MLPRYTLEPMQRLWADERVKFEYWLKVELAILRAQATLGQITWSAVNEIEKAADFDLARIHELDAEINHDLIAFVKAVQEKLVENGAEKHKDLFHKIPTSYDIEDPAQIMMLREASQLICTELFALETILKKRAREHRWTLMIARTHGQYAQPDTFGHLLLVFGEAVGRSVRRFEWILNLELSEAKISGAVGNYAEISPEIEKLALGFLKLKPARAETQILQRDRHAALLSTIAIAGATIEQMSRTFWEMMRSDTRELEEPRKPKQRGSSAMGHKKNPILTEQFMGLPRLLRGYALAAIENIATPEWRAIEQSSVERHILPDATSLLHYQAVKATKFVERLVVFPDRMLHNLNVRTHGVWASQRIRNALMSAGVDYDTAYEYIQRISFLAVDTKTHLRDLLVTETLTATDARTAVEILDHDQVDQFFDAHSYVEQGTKHLFGEE